MHADILNQSRLSIISRCSDPEIDRIADVIEHPIRVEGRDDLEAVLCALLAHGRAGAPKTLDLIGHSVAGTSLLALGNWVIDAASPVVTAFFRELADQEILARLGIQAVRLLGCGTAETASGRWTVCALAELLGIDVYGTTGVLLASHYDPAGFMDVRRYLLQSAAQLLARGPVSKPTGDGHPSGSVLDIDAIAPVALDEERPWPVHVVTAEQARELLSLVRRGEGSILPSLVASPSCELALPSAESHRYHRLEVVCDGQLVRVRPRGSAEAVVYPVRDAATFLQLIAYARGC